MNRSADRESEIGRISPKGSPDGGVARQRKSEIETWSLTDRLLSLQEITMALSECRSIHQVAESITGAAMAVLDASASSLIVFDPDTSSYAVAAYSGSADPV